MEPRDKNPMYFKDKVQELRGHFMLENWEANVLFGSSVNDAKRFKKIITLDVIKDE